MKSGLVKFLLWLLNKLNWSTIEETCIKLRQLELSTSEVLLAATTKLSDLQIKATELITSVERHLDSAHSRSCFLVENTEQKLSTIKSQALVFMGETSAELTKLQLSTAELLTEAARLSGLKKRTLELMAEARRNQLHYQDDNWIETTVYSKLVTEYPETPEAELLLTVKACCE